MIFLRRVTCINLPGFGSSGPLALGSVGEYADHVARTMDALALPADTAVFGNGFGAFVALELATRHGGRFGRLMVADTLAAFPEPAKLPFRGMAERRRPRSRAKSRRRSPARRGARSRAAGTARCSSNPRHWPDFSFDAAALAPALAAARRAQGEVIGLSRALGMEEARNAEAAIWTSEALATAAIEGEKFDLDSVRSSIARRLGLTGRSRRRKRSCGMNSNASGACWRRAVALTTSPRRSPENSPRPRGESP